jgi:tyrosine-protein phosphatase SIW14
MEAELVRLRAPNGEDGPFMPAFLRWTLGLVIAAMLTVVPAVHFRWVYTHGKRLREVTSGHFYRSGEMTAAGFIEAVRRYRIGTIVNLQDEYPDPDLPWGYLGGGSIKESELCRLLGVRYVYIPPDLLPRRMVPEHRPLAIDRFLALLDDPHVFPVLIHCRAGLHRTGIMTAVYRMEYCGWSQEQAIEELKANGFGDWPCTSANDYITQYILTYKPGTRTKD